MKDVKKKKTTIRLYNRRSSSICGVKKMHYTAFPGNKSEQKEYKSLSGVFGRQLEKKKKKVFVYRINHSMYDLWDRASDLQTFRSLE